MKALKVLSIIFTILGIIINFSTLGAYSSDTAGAYLFAIAGLGIGIWMLVTITLGKKHIAAGILGIIFTGIAGGIFYLCWDPEKEN